MTISFRISVAVVLGTGLLVVFGCDEGASTASEAPLSVEKVDTPEKASTSAFRFTGRDSFGVALKGHLAGSSVNRPARCESETVALVGTGSVTHLGRTEAELSHCYDASTSLITDGKIVLNGATGGVLQGTYEGRLVQASGAFSVEVKINDGSIRATRADSEEGKATLRGAMSSNQDFTTALDGWLLHHVRAEQ